MGGVGPSFGGRKWQPSCPLRVGSHRGIKCEWITVGLHP